MRVKLNRGPMNGKYIEVEAYQQDLVIQMPKEGAYAFNTMHYPPTTTEIFQRGTYHRSNVTLKNGARVYEWMGWLNG